VTGDCRDESDYARWVAAGVDRLIVAPWRRSSEASSALVEFAARFITE